MISDQLRKAVQLRAVAATSRRQIGKIILSTLSDSGVDLHQVDRAVIKQLVVDAVRAYRGARRMPSAAHGGVV